MVSQITRKSIIFLFIFLFPLITFAFDTEYAHPLLTEDIVRYYNHFAKRKITEEEIKLIKQGSILEDSWPRWVNHFYVALNNTGLNLEILEKGLGGFYKTFISSLPYKPLKSPEWAQDELAQMKYLNNKTYQKAKRLYFENKNEAFLVLGHLLHLIEDLGIPDHARGDSHSGKVSDNLSGYEEYAKEIFKKYNVNFSKILLEKGENPYYFRNLDLIFDSISKFTASNWFSEDTINLFNLPTLMLKKETQKEIFYYNTRDELILKEIKVNKGTNIKTTNHPRIHQNWFNSVIPEILKHGAALLNLYFSEIEEMEREEAIKLYEFDIGRRVEFANFSGFFSNLKPYFLSILWQGGEKIVKTVNSVSSLFHTETPFIKSEYVPETNITQQFLKEKVEREKITYKEEKIIEPQEQIVYKEEKRIVHQETRSNIEITKSFKLITTTDSISTTTEKRATSTFPQEKEDKPKIIYVSGGFSPPPKNPCDDYKNKNYPNILINEIQFETKTGSDPDPKDEFIELYNPNNEEVDLTCWSLEKYTSKQNPTSTPELKTLIPSSKFVGKIKPYSFFLITSSSTKEKYQGDLSYAESYYISNNNVVLLRKPNGEISDLVGYGDNNEEIYQFEGSPFIASSTKFENKSIQRKNFQDTNNNSQDFWLHKSKPENSNSPSQLPRQDFADLSQIKIENFNVFITPTEEEINLNLEWQEPFLNLSSTNYAYEVLISTSTQFNTFKLEDFGAISSLPSPKFDSSTTTFQTEVTKCPTTSTLYYFGIYLKDLLDEENKTDLAITSTTLPETLCNHEEPIISNTSTTTTSTGKVLISEVRILTGTSTGEFIELYNPNDFDIDLTGWHLEKINSKGNSQVIVPASKFKGVIPAFSYFLLVNGTSSDLIFSPDIIYSKSHNLAKNNGLRLYDKDNNLIDEFFWQEINNQKSFQRKKTASSTEISLLNEEINLGNAYDTDQNSDFLLAQPNPENSSIKKETIKEIKNFKIETQDKIYKFFWFSPAFYDKDLFYEIRYSTSSDFSNSTLIATTSFLLLTNQILEINLCPQNLLEPIYPDSIIYFKINLIKNSIVLKSDLKFVQPIDCQDITKEFEIIPGPTARSGGFLEFKVLKDLTLNKIYIFNLNVVTNFTRAGLRFSNLETKITKTITTTTEIQIPTTTYINITTTITTTEDGSTTTIEISTTTPTTTYLTTTISTTTEEIIFTTTTFSEFDTGWIRFSGLDSNLNGHGEPYDFFKGKNNTIDHEYSIYEVPVNGIFLNKDEVIKIYASYSEVPISYYVFIYDDGWWIYKFKGQ